MTSYIRHDVNRSPKVAAMISHAVDLETIVVATEMEALILENNLIKKHHPRYNIMLRDDKTILHQGHRPRGLSADFHDPPRQPRRRPLLRPFADSTAVHRVLKLMQRAYISARAGSCRVTGPACNTICTTAMRLRPLHYQADYNDRVDQAVAVLEGRDNGIVRTCRIRCCRRRSHGV